MAKKYHQLSYENVMFYKRLNSGRNIAKIYIATEDACDYTGTKYEYILTSLTYMRGSMRSGLIFNGSDLP